MSRMLGIIAVLLLLALKVGWYAGVAYLVGGNATYGAVIGGLIGSVSVLVRLFQSEDD